MENTHDLGRLYCHTLTYPSTKYPLAELGSSHEVEEPWRVGRCVTLRAPLTRRAAVVGWWGPARSYDELLKAEQALQLAQEQSAENIRIFRRPA